MSKERLEEIKKELELDWSDISYVVNQDDVKWLINRVEELEEELYGNDIQMGYKRMYGSCNRDYAKLLQQNKRYREVIKKAIDDLENECLWDALAKLKALEGEE